MSLTLKTFHKDWENDVRMNSLYAPFRKKELNPVDYESKMTFWKTQISGCLGECGCCTFSVEDLVRVFIRKGRKPMCLKEVIDRMMSEGEINYESDFELLLPSNDNNWKNWAVRTLVSNPLKWSYSILKDSLVSRPPTNYDLKFVHLDVTKNKAEYLFSNIKDEFRGTLLYIDQVKGIIKENLIRDEDINVVLHWLELEGLAVVTVIEGKKLVKFAEIDKKIDGISDADKAIYSLKENEKQLTIGIENLETQKQEAIQEAKIYLNKGMRYMAKSCLRKKKELEKQISKHVAALDNIQLLLSRIHDTEHNTKVFESYKISLSTLKNQFKDAGLNEDSVMNTMSQVQEVIDIHDDIQTLLGEPASNATASDEDYEAELEDLINTKPSNDDSLEEYEKELERITKSKPAENASEFNWDSLNLPEPPTSSPLSERGGLNKIKNAEKAFVL